ncbi:hypothetical protein B5X24_HaOG209020 [Helicoverpa armigera]|uniref:Glycosyltransferase 2-like domain-containing protein n=1 Tax=Helicoverpa armigera TaxID=29058 RepID=A0A2W1BLB5_HELAM|nr:hypothetical protein B5X24_HaOG209020 [Helicoverpa armigera]
MVQPRTGITRARLAGIKVATGQVAIFLDSHCEVIRDWLRPLLQHIKRKRDAVVVPDIHTIQESNFLFEDTGKHDQVAPTCHRHADVRPLIRVPFVNNNRRGTCVWCHDINDVNVNGFLLDDDVFSEDACLGQHL